MNKPLVFFILLLIVPLTALCQEDTTRQPVKQHKHRWSPSGFPVIAYDADMGFQYGIVGNLFDYGDWSRYPEYRHAIKLEISRFTKGSGVNQLFYDSKYLIPNIRFTADLSYLTEKAVDFYGFNGYQAIYHPEWEDEEDDDYLTRMFYRHERLMFRLTTDFQGNLVKDKLRWLAGIGIMNFKTGRVDFDRINKGRTGEDKIPDTTTLFDQYSSWNILPEDERNGGNVNFIKAGIVFDTRDNEPSPMKGLWEELLFVYSPEFLFNEQSFLKMVFIHRQYFTLVKKKLGLTYRLGYQGTIAGHTPFYFQPYMLSSFSYVTKTDGLGGAKNLRGVLRNRVVGDGVVWGNAEVRWRIVDFIVAKQNFYLGMNAFYDVGMVVQKYDLGEFNPATQPDYFDPDYDYDEAHQSVGAGIRLGWNENFIVSFDYGIPLNGKDGSGGFYVAFGNLW